MYEWSILTYLERSPRITLYSERVISPDISGEEPQDHSLQWQVNYQSCHILRRALDHSLQCRSDHSRLIRIRDQARITLYSVGVINPDISREEPQDHSLQCASDQSWHIRRSDPGLHSSGLLFWCFLTDCLLHAGWMGDTLLKKFQKICKISRLKYSVFIYCRINFIYLFFLFFCVRFKFWKTLQFFSKSGGLGRVWQTCCLLLLAHLEGFCPQI